MLQFIFFTALSCIVYIYIGYLGLIYILGKLFPKRHQILEAYCPRVAIIIPTRNEQLNISARLQNCLELDYPREKLRILVIDSASTDDTQNIVQSFSHQGVELLQVEHRGKAYAMEKGIEFLKDTEVIMSTDANAFFAQDVVKKIVRHFSDAQVGAVTGAMKQLDKTHTSVSMSGDIYWTIEKFLRIYESQFYSCISLSGEISCFRRELLVDKKWYHQGHPDDFDITLYMISIGKRVLYEKDAFVWEKAPDIEADVEKQKLRIIVQTIHALIYHAKLLFSSRFGVILFSHKILPVLSPLFLGILFFSNIFLLSEGIFFLFFFCFQIFFYIMFVFKVQKGILKIPYFLIFLNLVICKAYIEYFKGRDFTKWDKIMSSRQ